MTFDELFKDHNLTPTEREALVAYLAGVRASKTIKALSEPQRIGGPCQLCGQGNHAHGGGACPTQLVQPTSMADTQRLDWLCTQFVTVRTPLRYGSRENFMGLPDDNDGESVPWDIRKAIDAAVAKD